MSTGTSRPSSRSQQKHTAATQKRLTELAEKERARRRKQIGLGGGTIVVLIVVALIITRLASGSNTGPAAARTNGTSVAQRIAAVPVSATNAVSASGAATIPLSGQPPLTADGKPRVVYVGAEYCPYCAAERWAVTQALSRFGTFTNLGLTSSDPTDVHPNTPTVSFHGATYTSQYLSFTGIEQTDNKHNPLDATPADISALVTTYDAVPYVSSEAAGSIPFVDLGGKALISGAAYDPDVLKGLTQTQIATDLSNPSTSVAKAVLPAANSITKTLCGLTKNLPAAVCSASGVSSAT